MIHVVAGNLAMDRTHVLNAIVLGEVNRPVSSCVTAGGKGFNVARFLRTLGHQVRLYGFLGGLTGQYLDSECARLGIVNHCVQVKEDTRICNIYIEEQLHHVTVINEKGPVIGRAEQHRLQEKVVDEIQNDDVLIFGGSLAEGVDQNFYLDILQEVKRKTKTVTAMVDCHGEPLWQTLKGQPWLVKVNEREFRGLGLGRGDLREMMSSNMLSNIELLIVTRGHKGSLLRYRNRFIDIAVPNVDAINPTGSGDAYLAGVAAAWVRTSDVVYAVQFAAACSVVNAKSITPEIALDDVATVFPQIKIIEAGTVSQD